MVPPEKYQIELFRKMKPSQKIRIFGELYRTAYQLKEAGLRWQHPDWNDRAIKDELRRIFLYARS